MHYKKPKPPCKGCGAPVVRHSYTYCRPCISAGAHLRTIASLEAAASAKTRRRILILERGPACWACRNSTWLGLPITLEIDHIDGHADNNERSNLRILCPNCHAQTPTYKAKNKGNGRAFRRVKLAP